MDKEYRFLTFKHAVTADLVKLAESGWEVEEQRILDGEKVAVVVSRSRALGALISLAHEIRYQADEIRMEARGDDSPTCLKCGGVFGSTSRLDHAVNCPVYRLEQLSRECWESLEKLGIRYSRFLT